MSGRKQKRKGRRPRPETRRGKSRGNASLVFVTLLILAAAAVAAVVLLGGEPPVDCPPGQVWSDAHNHCH